MPDWLTNILADPASAALLVTALGAAVTVPLFNLVGQWLFRKGPTPPPLAHDARDLPEHPLLVSAKVHLNEPELEMLKDIAARTRRNERQLDRIIEKIDHVNDRLD